jgi:hypothetical protein
MEALQILEPKIAIGSCFLSDLVIVTGLYI